MHSFTQDPFCNMLLNLLYKLSCLVQLLRLILYSFSTTRPPFGQWPFKLNYVLEVVVKEGEKTRRLVKKRHFHLHPT